MQHADLGEKQELEFRVRGDSPPWRGDSPCVVHPVARGQSLRGAIRFYLHFVEPQKKAIADGLFDFASLEQLGGWEGDLGLQFENLVLNHVNLLFPQIGLERSLVLSASPYVQHATNRVKGCQIDLLIQTRKTLFVVEIKRRREIRHEVVGQVAEKVRRLQHRKDLSVRTVLVYDGELAKSIPADRFFDFIVPAERLLLS